MKKIEKVQKYTIYVSDDGTEFASKYEAKLYEWRQKAKKVWIVYERGQRSNEIEIYSTRDLAEEGKRGMFKDDDNYYIDEVILDERIYLKNEIDGINQ